MREISCELITETVAQLCIKANTVLPPELANRIECMEEAETSPVGKSVLGDMVENFRLAAFEELPICQDTGMAVVLADVGQDVHIVGGSFEDAVNAGVRKGYLEGGLRLSVVKDPLRRENTGDNSPAVLHTRIVPGDTLRITVAPKGFGSENMSQLKMFLPSVSQAEIEEFIVSVVTQAGSRPCPPVVLGVGLGGTMEQAALLAKRALCRPIDRQNPDEYYRAMENRVLSRLNETGIGPQGFGGFVTALAVNIEAYPTHIAGLPCAVNVGCHVTRHAEKEI